MSLCVLGKSRECMEKYFFWERERLGVCWVTAENVWKNIFWEKEEVRCVCWVTAGG